MSYFNINRVVLIGRLTHDPELRALPSGVAVCNLRVACNSSRRDPEGAYREKPNYFDVSVYGSAAENVERYTRRGARIAIDGRLEWREWETSEQRKRQAVSVVADTVQFLDWPGGKGREEGPDEGLNGEEPREDGELVGVGAHAEEDLVF
jgi:single-strand DNA-binding protein